MKRNATPFVLSLIITSAVSIALNFSVAINTVQPNGLGAIASFAYLAIWIVFMFRFRGVSAAMLFALLWWSLSTYAGIIKTWDIAFNNPSTIVIALSLVVALITDIPLSGIQYCYDFMQLPSQAYNITLLLLGILGASVSVYRLAFNSKNQPS